MYETLAQLLECTSDEITTEQLQELTNIETRSKHLTIHTILCYTSIILYLRAHVFY